MFRISFLAAAVVAAGAAQAGDYPRLVGGGENATVEYAGPSQNVLGGGTVRLSGGGDDATFAYQNMNTMPGVFARMEGGGDNTRVVMVPQAPTTSFAARPGMPRG